MTLRTRRIRPFRRIRRRRNPDAPLMSVARTRALDDLADAYRTYVQQITREERDPTDTENDRFAQQHDVPFLGSGYARAVFRVPEGALKIMKWRPPYRDNEAEARLWAAAPAEVRPHLVPVLAHANNYGWLLMPEVEMGGDVPQTGKEALKACGISDFQNKPVNVSSDGRLVDYGLVDNKNKFDNCLKRGSSKQTTRASRPVRRLRRNPEDRGYVRDLLARLQEFRENVMEAAEVDPYETSFDPMDYPIDDSTLQAYLDAPVLGWGASRVVVLLPSGNVAKLPWSDADEANEREWDNWNDASEASSEVQEMLLPPLEYIAGVLVFPHAETVHHLDYDDPALAAAREKWKRLYLSNAPGANAQDFQNTQNWGIYQGRLVLLDYAD